MQEHPSKLILGWMGHLVAPEWDDKKAYNNCYHCNQRFQIGHQHHCRLCGHMFCSMCTAKYLVSSQFKRKDKDGPDRVCFGCRNQCLERRSKFIKNEPPLKPQMVAAYDNAGVMHIYPPVWAKAGSYMNCKLCHDMLVKGNTHHCRACGEMFDKNCTTKLEVPQAFKKKPKNGPCRICYECRYHILSGKALLDERPISALNSNMSLLNTDTPPSAKMFPISVVWEDANEKPIVTLNVIGQCTLDEINTRLLRAAPEMKKIEYTYICRGRPIFKEHWGVFNAEFISPEILVRQGTLEVIPDDHFEMTISRSLAPVLSKVSQQNDNVPQYQSKIVSQQSGFEANKPRKLAENGTAARTSLTPKLTTTQQPKPALRPLNTEPSHDVPVHLPERPSPLNIARMPTKQSNADKFDGKSPEPLRQLKFGVTANDQIENRPSSPDDAKLIKSDGKTSNFEEAFVNGNYLLVRSRYDFKTDKATLLSCVADENLIIIKRPEKSGWWLAQNASKQKGWVPARYMQVLHEYTSLEKETAVAPKEIE